MKIDFILIQELYRDSKAHEFVTIFAQTARKVWQNLLNHSIFVVFLHEFRKLILKNELFDAFSLSRIKTNNNLEYFRTVSCQALVKHCLVGILFREFHHYLSRASDDLPGQENVLRPEGLDLLKGKSAMHIRKRAIAASQLVLIFLAALFMAALLARYLWPPLLGSAHMAQQIVMWYAGRAWTLWVLLIGLPLAVLAIGCGTLLPGWILYARARQVAPQTPVAIRVHPAEGIITAATVASLVILAVVAVHVLMN